MRPGIHSLKELTITPRTYFLDANVWLFYLLDLYLAEFGISTLTPSQLHQKAYAPVVEQLLGEESVKIAFTPLLVSEIVNAFVRKYAMRAYLLESGWAAAELDKAHFKHHYRDTPYGRDHYRLTVKFITDNLASYIESGRLVVTELGFRDPEQAHYLVYNFKSSPASDFNDYCYYELCLGEHPHQPWPLITDDADFGFNDLEIYTLNPHLLQKASGS
jgi:hypothetical protein